jgi:hypothetical protein
MNKKQHFFKLGAYSMAALLGLSGCGDSRDDGSGDTTTISGTLSLATNLKAQSNYKTAGYVPTEIGTDWTIRCMTLSDDPQSAEGTVNPDTGAFSLDLSNAGGAPAACTVLEDTTVIAEIIFEDTSTTGLDGNSSISGTFVAREGATGVGFGTVTLNSSTGLAEVDSSLISQEGGSEISNTWTDPTGLYNYEMFCDENLARTTAEYEACEARLAENQQSGETSGTVFVTQYQTTDEESRTQYGISLWQSEAAKTACGGEGVTLPSGWTVASGSSALTTALNFVGLPAKSALQNQWQMCGSSASTCDQVTNAQNWSKPGGSAYSNLECQALCAASNLWSYGDQVDPSSVCVARVGGMNFGYTGTMTYSQGASFIGTGTGSGQFLVKFSNEPDSRFALGRATIVGSTASIMSKREYEENDCVNRGVSGCTQVTCEVIEKEKIVLFQKTDGTTRVQISSSRSLAKDANQLCLAEDGYLRQELGEEGVSESVQYVDMTPAALK